MFREHWSRGDRVKPPKGGEIFMDNEMIFGCFWSGCVKLLKLDELSEMPQSQKPKVRGESTIINSPCRGDAGVSINTVFFFIETPAWQ